MLEDLPGAFTALLPVAATAGAFGFLRIFTFTKFRVAREEGHRLYFRTIYTAVALTAIGSAVVASTENWFRNLGVFEEALSLSDVLVLAMVGTALAAPLVAWLIDESVMLIQNRFFRIALPGRITGPYAHALRGAIKADSFELRILEAVETLTPIRRLDSRSSAG